MEQKQSKPPASSGESSPATLVVEVGGSVAQTLEIHDAPITIGRHEGCDIPIPQAAISRQHAEVFTREGRFYIRDLGSANGTFVNGKRITERLLVHGCRIQIGSGTILFRAPGEAAVPSDLDSSDSLVDILVGATLFQSSERADELRRQVLGEGGAWREEPAAPSTATTDRVDTGLNEQAPAGWTYGTDAMAVSGIAAAAEPPPLDAAPAVPAASGVLDAAGGAEVTPGAPSGELRLCIQNGPLEGQRLTFRQDIVSIGRSDENDIAIDHHSMSRDHAAVRRCPLHHEVQDRLSTNGTWLNGVRLAAPAPLHAGDRLRLGEIEILVEDAFNARAVLAEADQDRPARPAAARARAARYALVGVAVGLVLSTVVGGFWLGQADKGGERIAAPPADTGAAAQDHAQTETAVAAGEGPAPTQKAGERRAESTAASTGGQARRPATGVASSPRLERAPDRDGSAIEASEANIDLALKNVDSNPELAEQYLEAAFEVFEAETGIGDSARESEGSDEAAGSRRDEARARKRKRRQATDNFTTAILQMQKNPELAAQLLDAVAALVPPDDPLAQIAARRRQELY